MESKRDVVFVFKQYIDGKWVELIGIPTEIGATEKEISESMDEFRKLFMGEKAFAHIPDKLVVFKCDKPIKIDVVEKRFYEKQED